MEYNLGDRIVLKNQNAEIAACEKCGKSMVNIDANQLALGDLSTLKASGVMVSNPETEDKICVNCEYAPTVGHRLATWFNAPSTSDDDDSSDDSFFHSSGSFLGGSSSGGFGGFGGGSFSGGGASSGF